jgi:hypothetical protein
VLSARFSRHLGWTALLPMLALLASCTQGKSYIVVTLEAQDQAIAGVARVRLALSSGGLTDELTYAAKPGPTLEIAPTVPTTLSVSFSETIAGTAMLTATPLDANGTALGYGENTSVQIASGTVAYATVLVRKGGAPPSRSNAGATDGAAVLFDAGGDAGLMMCTPASTTECGANSTCGQACMGTNPTSKCIAAGTKQPGEACSSATDCVAGTQCFAENCGPKVCKKFCKSDMDCSDGGSCFSETTCSGVRTGIRTCSHSCDPTASATKGCAVGLRCILFSQEVTNCECVSPKQFGADNAPCETTENCSPGTFCVRTGASSSCRTICKLAEANTCGANRECVAVGASKANVYGACFPKL